jgi:hypothetical protein
MPAVDTEALTSLRPEQVRAALLDFSERRPEIWPSITPRLYEVRTVGESTAEVKEGTRLAGRDFWEVARYDWSDPATVRWTVLESNFCKPGSFLTATLERLDDGGTRVRIHWERTGSTPFGRFACRLIVLTRGKPVAESFRKAFRGLERDAGSAERATG